MLLAEIPACHTVEALDMAATELCFDNDDHLRIDWNANHRLQWSDFQGEPDYENWRVAAVTSSLIQFSYYCDSGVLKCDSKAVFMKDNSWVKADEVDGDYLVHEQLHFDITELYARKMRKMLDNNSYACEDKPKLEAEAERIFDDWRWAQKKYDWQTNYSLDLVSQKSWKKYIADQIAILDNYR